MENKKEDGGPAFPPVLSVPSGSFYEGPSGMSLRDWFAGMVMAALTERALIALTSDMDIEKFKEIFARSAFSLADAMLSERNKK